MSLDEDYKVTKGAKANEMKNQLTIVFVKDAVMIPTKLLIFLEPNTRFSKFDAVNFISTFIMFTYGINAKLAFSLSQRYTQFNQHSSIRNCLTLFALFALSQLGLIGSLLTF